MYSKYVNRCLKLAVQKNGYVSIHVRKDKQVKNFWVHRIVGLVFIPNPDNYPMINHKDENPANNRVDNLEWCDCVYNVNYGTAKGRMKKTMVEKYAKPVFVYNQSCELVYKFSSLREASDILSISSSNISECISGKTLVSHDYVFANQEITQAEIKKRFADHKTRHRTFCGKAQPVAQYDLNHTYINSFPSIRRAADATGFSFTAIKHCCGKEDGISHGFRWRKITSAEYAALQAATLAA